jgi:hypothetical protein
MAEARNALPITGNPIPEVDIEAPIHSAETPSCEYYEYD